MGIKVVATNRKATHDYKVTDRYESGIVLSGTEVKSIRAGNINLRDGFCLIREGSLLLHNVHISIFNKTRK